MNCNYWESHHTDGQVMLLYRIVHLGICMKLREKTVCSFVLFFLKMEVGIFLNSWKERKKIVIVFFSLRDDYWMNFWGNTEVLIWIIGVNQWFFFFLFWITVLNIDFYSFSDFFLFFLMKCYTPVFNCK